MRNGLRSLNLRTPFALVLYEGDAAERFSRTHGLIRMPFKPALGTHLHSKTVKNRTVAGK
jgi:hypothetical protein